MKKISKIGLIGDVHCEDVLLSRALDFLSTQNLDTRLCVGDITDGRGDVDRCCDLLKERSVQTVAGNHDRWGLAGSNMSLPDATDMNKVKQSSIEFLASLPKTIDYETSSGKALLCHGLGENDMALVKPEHYGYDIVANVDLQKLIHAPENYKFVMNGHSHDHMVREIDGLTIINAGTLKRDHDPCFVVADFENRQAQFYGFEDDKIVELELQEF